MNKSKKILDSLEQPKGQKIKTSLYLNKVLFEKFKKKCKAKNVSASRVLEKLIEDFLDEIKN